MKKANDIEVQAKQAPVTFSFLPNKKISVRPVPADASQWAEIMANPDKLSGKPYLFENTVRGFTLPESVSMGRLIECFDTDRDNAKYTHQYPKEKLTEHEFMEKQLGKDLSYNKRKNDESAFWFHDKLATVEIPYEGLELDLSNPVDYLRFKILKANKSKIGSNLAHAKRFRHKFSYFFHSSSDLQEAKEREANQKNLAMKAVQKLNESPTLARNFLRVSGIPVDAATSFGYMQTKILEIYEGNYGNVLKVTEDPNFETKADIMAAKAIGELKVSKRGKETYYKLADNEMEIGKLDEAVRWWLDPENDEVVSHIINRIHIQEKGQ